MSTSRSLRYMSATAFTPAVHTAVLAVMIVTISTGPADAVKPEGSALSSGADGSGNEPNGIASVTPVIIPHVRQASVDATPASYTLRHEFPGFAESAGPLTAA